MTGIVRELCQTEQPQGIINVTGPEKLSYKNLIDLLFNEKLKKYKIVEAPKMVFDVMVKYTINPLFPNLINSQQYKLLFTDNIADHSIAEKYLGKPLTSTGDFWKTEFK